MYITSSSRRSGFTLVELLVVIGIIAGLAAISSPIIIRQIAKARATTAISNSKDIYVGIRDYAVSNTGLMPEDTANANTSFRLLFSSGKVTDEKPFYVKGTSYPGAAEGDGNVAATEALDTGENVFSYYTDAGLPINIYKASANTPVISCPAQNEANIYTGVFYTRDFGAQAVILRSDGSSIAYPITEGATPNLGTLSNTDGTALIPTAGGDDFSTIVCKLPAI